MDFSFDNRPTSSVSILIEVAAGTLDCSAVGMSPRPEQVQGHNQRFPRSVSS
jgi:hypothetical protein